jgi:hypothetical protein
MCVMILIRVRAMCVCVCVRGVASSDDAMVRVMMNEWW